MEKKKFMLKALWLAKKGKGKVHPNPLVGCVVVKPAESRLLPSREQAAAQILGQGFYKEFGAPHAEIVALREAGKKIGIGKKVKATAGKLQGAGLYVTLEPCNFFGKTPPCTEAIVKAGVGKVFVAMLDPNPRVNGEGVKELRKKGVRVEIGLCKEEAMQLNEAYVKFVKTGKPFVLLKIALTGQGFISWGGGKRKRISGKESLERVQELRNEFDAVLVGINTVKKDNPKLTCGVKGGRNPVRVLLDTELEVGLKSDFLKKNSKRIIFCGKKISKQEKKKLKLEKLGVEIIQVKEKNNLLNLKEVLRELGERGIVSVLVEGGQGINSSFLKEKLADKIMFFVGKKRVKEGMFFVDRSVKRIELKKVRSEMLGKDLVVEGYLN